MPLYEYECLYCHTAAEVFKPMAEAGNTAVCERCGCAMERVYSVPTVKTSNTYQACNGGLGGAQFSDTTREFYLNAARKAGVSPEGKFYEGRAARFPGDPEAWVSSADDVKAIVERRGWSMEGDMKVKGPEVEAKRDAPLADDIVEDLVENRLAAQLGEDFDRASGKMVEQAREDVIHTHSPPKHLEG